MQKWQCRIAPSLGDGFAGHPNDVWGTVPYTNPDEPCVFFGMYGLRDYQVFYAHRGEKRILWCGSDIRNYLRGYWLDKTGEQRVDVKFPSIWKPIKDNGIWGATSEIISYVENDLEAIALASKDVPSIVVPSFLGDVNKYQPQEIRTDKERYYTSVSGDDFELYGWDEIPDLAKKNPDTEYHLYGNMQAPQWADSKDIVDTLRGLNATTRYYLSTHPNITVHGRVSQEQMDEETKTMTGALRLTRFDGASEILVKSTLWGQKPISPYIHYDWLGNRDKLISIVNKYPWVSN